MIDLTDDQVRALLDRGEQLYNDAKHHIPLQARCADLARALLQARADAAAAVALMVERAAEQADPWDGPVTKNKIVDAQAIAAQQIKARIRALASDAGTAELAKLREHVALSQALVEGAERKVSIVEAERDALAASLAAQTALGETLTGAPEAVKSRKTFPILKGEGAKIDYQLVADHAEQARANHYQTVERLAERGGLSWCELYAVLHNRKWEKIEANEAMIACRALEARYLAATTPPPSTRAALEAAEIATMTPEQRALYRVSMDMRAVAKGIADDQIAARDAGEGM